MRFASTRCRTPRRNRLLDTIAAAPALAAATLHGKTLPPQHKSHARFMQPLQCVLQHHAHIHALQNTKEEPIARDNRSSTRRAHKQPFIAGCSHFTRKTTRFHAPASSPTQHHFPQSPAFVITTSFSHHHHFPESPLLLGTTSLSHHPSSSPLPLDTTSLSHHPSSSPLHHPSSSPLPLVTTSFSHHHSSSPLPSVTTLRRHHFTALRHDH